MKDFTRSLMTAAFAAITSLSLAGLAGAQTIIYVPTGPPPPMTEVRPAPPGHTYTWIAGYYRWDEPSQSYVWVPGHYIHTPATGGTVWVPGHWRHGANGWYWVPGHWRTTE